MNTLHSSMFTGELQMKAIFHMQGPQPVGTLGGAPQWVADAMDENDEIKQVVVIRENGGVIYSKN